MTDYNLPFNGNDVRDGLTRVVSPDLSPQSPSTKMVTSEGIKTALDAKLDASALVTNLNSPNNTTVPTTAAVTSLISSGADVTTITKSTQVSTNSQNQVQTGFSVSGGVVTYNNSNGTFTLPTGIYMYFLKLEMEAYIVDSEDKLYARIFIDGTVDQSQPFGISYTGLGTTDNAFGWHGNSDNFYIPSQQTFQVKFGPSNYGTVKMRNFTLVIIRIPQ